MGQNGQSRIETVSEKRSLGVVAAYGSMVSLADSQSNCHNWFCLNELGRFFDAPFRNMRRFYPSAAPLAAYYFQIVADRNNRGENVAFCLSNKLQPVSRTTGKPPAKGLRASHTNSFSAKCFRRPSRSRLATAAADSGT